MTEIPKGRRKSFRTSIWADGKPLDAFEATCDALDGSDYDRGALEEVAWEADAIKEAFGRFLQVMHDKRKLTDEEIMYILGSRCYLYDREQF